MQAARQRLLAEDWDLATVGGALGAGLETDDAVREAAYSYRASTATA